MRDTVLPAMAGCGRSATRSSAPWPTTSGRCRSTRRSSSSGRPPPAHHARRCGPVPSRGWTGPLPASGSLRRHDRPRTGRRVVTNDEVVAAVEERDVRFIRLWFTDILGQLKSFAITRDEVRERAGARDGLRRLLDHRLQRDRGVGHDRHARPGTFAVLPYRPQERSVARMFCDIRVPGGEPYEGDPRYVLRRALERAKAMGFDHFYLGPELEYFYFQELRRHARCSTSGGYFDLTTLDAASDLRRRHRDGARGDRDRDRVLAPRGRAVPARDRHALRRCAARWPTTS